MGLAISYALSVTGLLSGVVTSFTETEKQMVSVERALQYITGAPTEADSGRTEVYIQVQGSCRTSYLRGGGGGGEGNICNMDQIVCEAHIPRGVRGHAPSSGKLGVLRYMYVDYMSHLSFVYMYVDSEGFFDIYM